MNKGVLIVLSGPSGCGKGTVLKKFFEDGGDAFLSVSATTRDPRPGEKHGVHYYFMSQEEFLKKIAEGEILEHACFCDHLYGTPRGPVYERLERGENVILEIEVQGAFQIREKCPEAVLVFVMPPSLEVLRQRLTDRGTEDAETVEKRLETAISEIKKAPSYDYIVVNDKLEDAVAELNSVIAAEKIKTQNRLNLINEVLHHDA